MTEENIMQIVRSKDTEEDVLPDECPESEQAIEILHKRSLEGKYAFINVIILSVVLLACAVYFISLTSGDRYSDEGIKLSPKGLVDGSVTAEITKRYYSTIAYPEQTDKLYERLSSFYGITGEGRESSEKLRRELDIAPTDQHKPVTATKKQHSENEVTASVTASDTETSTTTTATDPRDNSTVFSRTTTVSTTLNFDPLNPWSTTTTGEPTTTNTTPPPATMTTTAAPVSTTTTPAETQTETTTPSEEPPTDTPDDGGDE